MNQKVKERLSESSDRRAVDRLHNGQVLLNWDHTMLRMRVTDLIVLSNALRRWMENPDRDWAQTYSLLLNDCTMFMKHNDLVCLCAMVQDATEQLSRYLVRWADLNVRIVPYTGDPRGIPCLSPN